MAQSICWIKALLDRNSSNVVGIAHALKKFPFVSFLLYAVLPEKRSSCVMLPVRVLAITQECHLRRRLPSDKVHDDIGQSPCKCLTSPPALSDYFTNAQIGI